MKLLLFDWQGDGHHGVYMERVSEALAPCWDVVLAGPDDVLDRLSGLNVDVFPLGDARPAPEGRSHEDELIAREWSLLERAVTTSRADRVLHLYSYPLIGHLPEAPTLGIPTAITLFYPRWHYPWTYRTFLVPRDATKALLLERALSKWRSRSDSLAVFSLDEAAVTRWNRGSGAPAFWFPEPPVPQISHVETAERKGCVLYGALAPRKGVDRLAVALAHDSGGLHAVLAGSVEPGYVNELDRLVDLMRAGGATVVVHGWTHHEIEGLQLLARARCAVLPYHRHSGMSRVLVEAAAVGTPVLVHDHGLIAALVKRHGIGIAADCDDADAFRKAIHALCRDGTTDRYRPALRNFAARYSHDRFAAALRAPFRFDVEPATALVEAGR